jgi:hypothetical protein
LQACVNGGFGLVARQSCSAAEPLDGTCICWLTQDALRVMTPPPPSEVATTDRVLAHTSPGDVLEQLMEHADHALSCQSYFPHVGELHACESGGGAAAHGAADAAAIPSVLIQTTSRFTTPAPHETEHWPHSPIAQAYVAHDGPLHTCVPSGFPTVLLSHGTVVFEMLPSVPMHATWRVTTPEPHVVEHFAHSP